FTRERPTSTISEFGMRPLSSTGSTARRRMPRLRSSHPSRSRASKRGSEAPFRSGPTKSRSGFPSLSAIAREPAATEASRPVSIAPQKVFGSDAEAVRQAQALSAFTALANAFFISMASLIPDVRIGIVVTIVAFASAMQTLALLTLVKHWRAQSIVYRGVLLF